MRTYYERRYRKDYKSNLKHNLISDIQDIIHTECFWIVDVFEDGRRISSPHVEYYNLNTKIKPVDNNLIVTIEI